MALKYYWFELPCCEFYIADVPLFPTDDAAIQKSKQASTAMQSSKQSKKSEQNEQSKRSS